MANPDAHGQPCDSPILRGCHAFHYAMISSAYAASQLISSPILGILSDRVGRKPILLGGLAATSVVCLGGQAELCLVTLRVTTLEVENLPVRKGK